ncbi:MAG: class I SAM-dependent methyltransferase, partial [Mycobacterium sp.]
MASIFESTPNVQKSLHYLPIYESAMAGFRDRPIRMLEIGVDRGGSMQMWRRYLQPESTIVGIDINRKASQFDNPSQNLHVRIGAQQDAAFLHDVIGEFGPFDVILDDGSHMTSHMVYTFRYLFPNGLASGGVYIVEDIGTNYQKPWRDNPMTFAEFTKWIIDAMHARAHGDNWRRLDFGYPGKT